MDLPRLRLCDDSGAMLNGNVCESARRDLSVNFRAPRTSRVDLHRSRLHVLAGWVDHRQPGRHASTSPSPARRRWCGHRDGHRYLRSPATRTRTAASAPPIGIHATGGGVTLHGTAKITADQTVGSCSSGTAGSVTITAAGADHRRSGLADLGCGHRPRLRRRQVSPSPPARAPRSSGLVDASVAEGHGQGGHDHRRHHRHPHSVTGRNAAVIDADGGGGLLLAWPPAPSTCTPPSTYLQERRHGDVSARRPALLAAATSTSRAGRDVLLQGGSEVLGHPGHRGRRPARRRHRHHRRAATSPRTSARSSTSAPRSPPARSRSPRRTARSFSTAS